MHLAPEVTMYCSCLKMVRRIRSEVLYTTGAVIWIPESDIDLHDALSGKIGKRSPLQVRSWC